VSRSRTINTQDSHWNHENTPITNQMYRFSQGTLSFGIAHQKIMSFQTFLTILTEEIFVCTKNTGHFSHSEYPRLCSTSQIGLK